MKPSFRTLKKEHIYFKQLLYQLEKQCSDLQPEDLIDWRLIDHLVNTLLFYPEQSHHPMEDDFLSMLKSRHWISDLIINSLHRDHEQLSHLGARAQAEIAAANQTCIKRQSTQALNVIQQFIVAYRNHIRIEEEVVFPMVEQLISNPASLRQSGSTAFA